MMANLTRIDDFLPADKVIEYEGSRYTLPGDPPAEFILRLLAIGERFEADEISTLEYLTECDAAILELLRLRDPSIERSPFGIAAAQQIVRIVLRTPGADEGPPRKARTSRSSTPSRSSSRSSGSRPTTGGA